jgi:ornithine carbamoyltransferase
MGDARFNMGNSWMVTCAKMGMHFTACAPKAYFPNPELVKICEELAVESGGSITLQEDVEKGTKDQDVVYTDVWVSMGEPAQVWETRIRELLPYQVNGKVMENAGPEAIFMHCLPAFHDLNTTTGAKISRQFGITEMEVTDEVFESAASVVFDEAENRMHTIKAVMAATLCENL